MSTILIKADSKTNKELYKLAKKMGGNVYSLKDEQFEDFAMGILMNKEKTNQIVCKEEILLSLH